MATEQFDLVLGDRPNQVERQRDDVVVTADDLLDMDFPGEVTLDGVRTNVRVGIQYLAAWLSGTGAAAIDNLMEDVATAEISRSQIWQWVHHGVVTADGTTVTESLVRSIAGEVATDLDGDTPHVQAARKVFEEVALSDDFVDFLTLSAYDQIN